MSVPFLDSIIHQDREDCGKNETGETWNCFGHAEFEALPDIQMKIRAGSWTYKSGVGERSQAGEINVRITRIDSN